MRKKKYHLYLTAEERRYVFNALLAYRNKLLAQGRYTDLIDEVMIKLQKRACNSFRRKIEGQGRTPCPSKFMLEKRLKITLF